MRKTICGTFVLASLFATCAQAVNLRLPWEKGTTWEVTVEYGGNCGFNCQDIYHTDEKNAFYAVDFDKPEVPEGSGTPILAVADGTVIFAGGDPDEGLGYYVKIDHGGGYVSLYGHLKEKPAVQGFIRQGDQIGKLGSTGNSTADHLHFVLYYEGRCLSKEPRSKPEPFSGYTNIRLGQRLMSDNDGTFSPTFLTAPVSKTLSPAGPYAPGQRVTCEIKFRNEGTGTWTKEQ